MEKGDFLSGEWGTIVSKIGSRLIFFIYCKLSLNVYQKLKHRFPLQRKTTMLKKRRFNSYETYTGYLERELQQYNKTDVL